MLRNFTIYFFMCVILMGLIQFFAWLLANLFVSLLHWISDHSLGIFDWLKEHPPAIPFLFCVVMAALMTWTARTKT